MRVRRSKRWPAGFPEGQEGKAPSPSSPRSPVSVRPGLTKGIYFSRLVGSVRVSKESSEEATVNERCAEIPPKHPVDPCQRERYGGQHLIGHGGNAGQPATCRDLHILPPRVYGRLPIPLLRACQMSGARPRSHSGRPGCGCPAVVPRFRYRVDSVLLRPLDRPEKKTVNLNSKDRSKELS